MLVGITAEAAVNVQKVVYHGWNEAFVISNGKAEAVVVPEIGRIMQFRFAGEEDGPFWENRSLDGRAPNPQSSEWINFGGDKTWPAPQAAWAKMTGRGWPPPQAFDSMPVRAVMTNQDLILISKVDPHYGIQTERRISLSPVNAQMKIETIYHKVEGAPVRVSIWVITQLRDPDRMFIPVPLGSIFASGYNKQSDFLPANLARNGDLLACTRGAKDSTKIGSDAGRLVWSNKKYILEISAPREAQGEFPDSGSSAEIYTNPDPNKYVEFELLGPPRQ
jgi:hypothetical protein